MNYWLMPDIKGISLVNQALGLPNGDRDCNIFGRKQGEDSNMVLTKSCAMKLLKDSGLSYPKIAKRMNTSDHTVPLKAVKKVNNFLSINDIQTQVRLEEVREILTKKHFI